MSPARFPCAKMLFCVLGVSRRELKSLQLIRARVCGAVPGPTAEVSPWP
jgi:hypothetical protein